MAESGSDRTSVSVDEALEAQRKQTERRGYGWNVWDWVARKDPEYAQARINYTNNIYLRENPALPIKYRELIASVVLAVRGYDTVGTHLRRALREGATMQECIEAFETATVPGGMPVLHFALPFLIEIDEELSGKTGQ